MDIVYSDKDIIKIEEAKKNLMRWQGMVSSIVLLVTIVIQECFAKLLTDLQCFIIKGILQY